MATTRTKKSSTNAPTEADLLAEAIAVGAPASLDEAVMRLMSDGKPRSAIMLSDTLGNARNVCAAVAERLAKRGKLDSGYALFKGRRTRWFKLK